MKEKKQSSLTSFMRSPTKSPGKPGSPAKRRSPERLPQLAIRLLEEYRISQQSTSASSVPADSTLNVPPTSTAGAAAAAGAQKTPTAPTSPQALQKAASAGSSLNAQQHQQQQQEARLKQLMQRCVRQLPPHVLQLMPEPLRTTLLQKRALFDEREKMYASRLSLSLSLLYLCLSALLLYSYCNRSQIGIILVLVSISRSLEHLKLNPLIGRR